MDNMLHPSGLLLLAACFETAGAVVFGHPSSDFAYPTYENFTLKVVEEFEAPINLDTDPIWTYSDGGLGEGRVRFVKEAIQFKDGKMILEAKETEEAPIYAQQTCSHANNGVFMPYKRLTSGEFRSKRNMFRYGRYEVRMKAPTVQPGNTAVNGNYVATLFIYKDSARKHWREVDIEVVGNTPGSVVSNILYANNRWWWGEEIAASGQNDFPNLNLRDGFHDYAVEWLPDRITWFLDGEQFREYRGEKVPVPEMAGKAMMSLWIFGDGYWFGGLEGDNNVYPMQVEYDWFRFYQWNDETYPCADPAAATPLCLTEDDLYLSGNNPCDGIAQEGVECAGQCDTANLVFGHPNQTEVYPSYEDFTLKLVEEFEDPLNLDLDEVWTWSDGGLSEGRVRFVKEAIQFKDGKMIIMANETEYSASTCSLANEGEETPTKQVASGELRTRRNMFRYGRYEVSMKAPTVQAGNTSVNGNYVATMFVYKDAKVAHWREIDIEVVGNAPGSVVSNVLNTDNRSWWGEDIAASNQKDFSENLRDDFHTYAFEWLPDRITWFLDGVQFREYRGEKIPVPDMAGKIMMSLWIFGDGYWFGGLEGDNNVYPIQVEYDWFRFYQWNKDAQYPCGDLTAVTPSCLSADDLWLSANNPCDGIGQNGRECNAVCAQPLRNELPPVTTELPTTATATATTTPAPASNSWIWILGGLVGVVIVCAIIYAAMTLGGAPAESKEANSELATNLAA